MEVVLVAAISLVALYFVAAPMRGGRRAMQEDSAEVAEASADKRTKLTALVELEEERFSGKLSEADFNLLRQQYESEAIEALKKLDGLTEGPDRDADLEAEIARVKSEMQCPNCGALRRSSGPCPECGA